jgi:hypothetical protein
MKKIIFAALLLSVTIAANAQDEEKETKKHSFKKENLFTGGSLTASIFNGGTVLGISPYFGYSINRFVDVAASMNLNYASQRDNFEYDDKLRQTIYGPGAFLRVYPVRFLFAQAQYEHNFIKSKYIPAANGSYLPYSESTEVNSFLVGGGISSGREGDGSSFYYISLMFDVIKDVSSPYVELSPSGSSRAFPIFKAGIQIPLFQGDGHRRR